jgi:hypothetical protein
MEAIGRQFARVVTPGKRGPKPRGNAKRGGNKKIKTGASS